MSPVFCLFGVIPSAKILTGSKALNEMEIDANSKSRNERPRVQPARYTRPRALLRELRGRPVVLAFYPADWSPVCGDELSVFNEVLPELRKYNAELLGISVDGAWSHDAFAKQKHLHFPLLSDFQPKGETARSCGAYREKDGVCERALFVLDKDGVIRWSYCYR